MVRTKPLYEIKLYLGSAHSRSDDRPVDLLIVTKSLLIREIGRFQDSYDGEIVPLRVTNTTFVSGIQYSEDGWEVAAINYPKTSHTHEQALKFMLDLGYHLLDVFLQKRICVADCHSSMRFDQIYMLE